MLSGRIPLTERANNMHVRQSDRAFGITFACVFTVINSVIWFFTDQWVTTLFVLSGAFLVIALAFPSVLLPLNRLWGLFGSKLSVLNNTLLVGLFYVLFLVPFGLVMRAFGRDPLGLKLSTKTQSYWQTPQRQLDDVTFKDMY